MKVQYVSKCIASSSEFVKNIGKILQRVICVFCKVYQIFLKGQYGSTRNIPDSSFSKDA